MTVPLPAATDPVELADWVEAILLVEGIDAISKAEMGGRLAPMGTPDESQLAMILSEVRRREGLGPGFYPFRVDHNVVERVPGIDTSVYEVLLLLSLEYAHFRFRQDWNTANLIMDRVARLALLSYMGPGSESVLFAWPVSGGRPTNFLDALEWLATHLGLELGKGPQNPHVKDGGVDVVCWRRFKDRRSSFSVLLAQCTYEAKFKDKAKDVSVNQWLSWIGFGANPSVALVVPYVIGVNDNVWDDIRFDAQVVIDRTRITELLAGIVLDPVELTDIEGWADIERTALAV
jgi:hypothetical protein